MYSLYDTLFRMNFLNVKNKSLDIFEKCWLEKTTPNQLQFTKLSVFVSWFPRSHFRRISRHRWSLARWFYHSLHGLFAIQARALCGDSHWPSVGDHCRSLSLTVSGSSVMGAGRHPRYGSGSGKPPSTLFMELYDPRRMSLLPLLSTSVQKSIGSLRKLISNIHL